MTRPLQRALLLVLLTGGLAGAQDEQDPPQETRLLDDVRRLEAAYRSAREELAKRMRATEDIGEREVLWAGRSTKSEDWTPRFWAVARRAPASEARFRALLWIRQHTTDAEEAGKVVGLLFRHHLDHRDIGRVCRRWVGNPHPTSDPEAGRLMRRILSESPHARTRGEAAYCLARYLEHNAPEERKDEIVRLLKQAIADCTDVLPGVFPNKDRPLSEAAEAALFRFQRLRVGCAAPDIVGEDADGVRFRLSDYRGKVVLLSFWAHW